MEVKRILTIVQVEMIRIFREPLTLIFTLLLVPMIILIMGLVMGSNYGWGEERSIFEIMVPGLLAYGSLLTIYDVAASVAGGRNLGLQRRINTTPLTSAEYIGSQMISYTIKPLLQLLLGLAVALIVGFNTTTTVVGYLLVFVFLLVLTFCSVGFGLITANFAKSANAAGGLAFIFIVPQQLFATIIPSEFMGAESFAWIMPSSYATDGITLIFDGTPLTDPAIWIRLGILFVISFVIYIIGIFVYEKNKNK
ncbi:MAG: ABC transporter permease [Candidatus Hodarchaeales archaeon]|jgi:ABC-2 type transport system permease protein